MSFSDQLTPGQVKHVLTALNIPWENYEPNNKGWITIGFDALKEQFLVDTYSKLGVNLYHGSFVDHSSSCKTEQKKGDIVKLVELIRFGSINKSNTIDSINWIKEVTGMNRGTPPPELSENMKFANDWLKDKNYVRLPNDIWQSNLSASAKLVWAAIFSRVGKGEIYSFAGIRNISKQTTLSKSSVQRAMKELVSAGLIIQKPSGIRKRMNRYPAVTDLNRINQKLATKPGD
jgi:hypothetical protein